MSSLEQSYNNSVSRLALTSARKPSWRASWRYALLGWRDNELRLLVLAIWLACAATTLLGFFADRLERGLQAQSQRYLGAPLVIRSSREAPEEWWQQAQQLGIKPPLTVAEFVSMASSAQGFQLAGVKAVPAGYPLTGTIRVQQADGQVQGLSHGPLPGEAWLAPRLMSMLAVKIGDQVQLGYADLKVTGVVLQEPDPSTDFLSLNPRLLVNSADLARSQVIQPGSRIRYRYLLDGSAQAIQAFTRWVTPQLAPAARILDTDSDSPRLASALQRVNQYLALGSILSVLLAVVTLALAARHYSLRHQDEVALWRCLGLSRRQLGQMLLLRLGLLSLVAVGLGVLTGALAQQGLVQLFRDWLPDPLPELSWLPAGNGVLTAVLLLVALVLPDWWLLLRTSPLRALKHESRGAMVATRLWLAGALLALLFWLWWQSRQPVLTFSVGGGLLLLLGVLFYSSRWLLARLLRRLGPLDNARLNWQALQVTAFALVSMAIGLVMLLRLDLLNSWREQLPEKAPNYFAINLQPDQQADFLHFLQQQGWQSNPLYPMLRGRLIERNGQPLKAEEDDGRDEDNRERNGNRAPGRELNLTWAAEPGRDNRIVQGSWWSAGEQQRLISIEEGFAKRYGLELGDQLTFDIAGEPVTAKVSSVRSVDWNSFNPNFFVIFTPGSLTDFPASLMTSFYVPPDHGAEITALSKTWPNITLIGVEALLGQLRDILTQLTEAVQYLFIFVLLAAWLVLVAVIQISLPERRREAALLHTLGVARQRLRQRQRQELLLLGAVAGALGAIGCTVLGWVVFTRVLELPFAGPWWLLGWPPLFAVVVALPGLWMLRQIGREPPLQALRRLL